MTLIRLWKGDVSRIATTIFLVYFSFKERSTNLGLFCQSKERQLRPVPSNSKVFLCGV